MVMERMKTKEQVMLQPTLVMMVMVVVVMFQL